MNEMNNELLEEKDGGGQSKWVPDCSIGECHVPDFSGESFLEFPTLDNVAKYADIEVRNSENAEAKKSVRILFRCGFWRGLPTECCYTTGEPVPAAATTSPSTSSTESSSSPTILGAVLRKFRHCGKKYLKFKALNPMFFSQANNLKHVAQSEDHS